MTIELVEQFRDVSVTLEEDKAHPERGKKTVLKGFFQEADKVNENNRLYARPILQREVDRLRPLIEKGQVTCHLDHPTDGKTRLRESASKLRLLELRPDGKVYGEAVILGTGAGKDLQALVDDGVSIGNSSRGAGTVKTETRDGRPVEVVNDDYRLMTFDHVAGQSVSSALVTNIVREQKESEMTINIEDLKKNKQDWDAVVVAVLESTDGQAAVEECVRAELEVLAEAAEEEGAEGEQLDEAEQEGQALAEQLIETAQTQEAALLAIMDAMSAEETPRVILASITDVLEQAGFTGAIEETEETDDELDEKHAGSAGGRATVGATVAPARQKGAARAGRAVPTRKITPNANSNAWTQSEQRVNELEQQLNEATDVLGQVVDHTVSEAIAARVAAKTAGHSYAEEITEALMATCTSVDEVDEKFKVVEQKLAKLVQKAAPSHGRGVTVLNESTADGHEAQRQHARRLAGIDS